MPRCPQSGDANTQPSEGNTPALGFSRRQRLLRPPEFKRVFSAACRLSLRPLTLLACPNGLGYARLGLAIPKKHVRRAVARNRIKRQVRESFRLHQDELAGLDIIFLARNGLDLLGSQVLRETLEQNWRNLAKRCGKS